MTSFRKFLEIAANPEMSISGKIDSFRKNSVTQGDEEQSHRIIPFVIHSDLARLAVSHIKRGSGGIPAAYRPAAAVFERLEGQVGGSGPGMVVTYISNVESRSIEELGMDMTGQSDSGLDRRRQGDSLVKAVRTGINSLKLNSGRG